MPLAASAPPLDHQIFEDAVHRICHSHGLAKCFLRSFAAQVFEIICVFVTMDEQERVLASKLASYTAPKDVLDDLPVGDDGDQAGSFGGSRRIVDRESDYSKRRLQRQLSPSRGDAFAGGSGAGRSYGDALREAQLAREQDNTLRNIEAKQREEEQAAARAA
ncbi:hypothetical protein H632_c359p3, partial [Helicosporidium sp. ATCC 50920]